MKLNVLNSLTIIFSSTFIITLKWLVICQDLEFFLLMKFESGKNNSSSQDVKNSQIGLFIESTRCLCVALALTLVCCPRLCECSVPDSPRAVGVRTSVVSVQC